MSVDHTLPEGQWRFDARVAQVFEDMLARSIPDYETMRKTVTSIGFDFVRDGSTIVDLGCSRGDALAPFIDRYGPRCAYVGVDVSEPMLEAARTRFQRSITVRIESCDLRKAYPYLETPSSLTLCVLTLQFIPIEYRQVILRRIAERLGPGGALILVEKVLGEGALIQELLIDHYHRLKMDNGYTVEEVERKRLSLEGVLVPLPAKATESMLRSAGFTSIDVFWRFLNFCGWIAVHERV